MRSHILSIAAVLSGASLISAQSISSGCEKSVSDVIASPDAACLNPSGLLPIFLGGANTSLVAPINNWLTGFCSAAPCSNQTLAAIVTNVTTGCSNELKALGLGSGTAAEITTTVQQFYPTVRKVLCLKDDSTNQNCITETLTNIEKTTGPLSFDKIASELTNPLALASAVPKDVICSNCVKAAYNVINQDLKGLIPSAANSTVSSTCGASFVDGQNPSGISQSAAQAAIASPSSSSKPKNTGTSLSGGALIGLTTSLLVAVSSAFALFA